VHGQEILEKWCVRFVFVSRVSGGCNINSRHVYATDMGASNVVETEERGWEEEDGIEVGR
jgi:hypothetical protein